MKHISKKTLPLLLLLSLAAFVAAQDTVYPKYVMRYLTSNAFHGRSAAYRGDSIAAKFLRHELERMGVKPLADNYYQHFTYPTHSMEGRCRMTLDGVDLRPYYDFRPHSFSADYHQALGETPLLHVPANVLIDSTALGKFLRRHRRAMAESVLYINVSDFHAASQAEAVRFGEAVDRLSVQNPFGSKVLLLGVKELSTPSFHNANRLFDYALVEVLADKIPPVVKDINLDVSSQYHPSYRTQNVCGLVEGASDSILVFTAHYDHLGLMGDSVVFRGTHDNASGVGAVMELARQCTLMDVDGKPLSKPKYTMVFLFFSGEEAGLYGSRYAAAHPVVDFSKVKLLVNVDMFCGGDEGLMVFNAKSEATKPYVERLQRLNEVLQICPELRLRENRPNSDHYPFTTLCPSIYILTLGGPYGGYHSPEDRLESCGLKNFSNYLTFIFSLAY